MFCQNPMSVFPLKKGTLNDFLHKQTNEWGMDNILYELGLISGILNHLRENRHKSSITCPMSYLVIDELGRGLGAS